MKTTAPPARGLTMDGMVESAILRPDGSRYDAGMRDLDHYAQRLPKWRYDLRQVLIPVVRLETPYLALMQGTLRCPALDSYFALTANLGTHTFFMIMLPILFWCGNTGLARGMVHVLAAGVFFSGWVKDLLCIPRPLSPPLQRITMSGSAALEYGFPSTHSTNAVSVAVYALHLVYQNQASFSHTGFIAMQSLLYFYATSIVFGRLYCGMHGFFDVIVGSLLGASLSALQIIYGDPFDRWICESNYVNPVIVVLIILLLVRTHPEPADDCPCFDDSVAFAGVVLGIEVGAWHFSQITYSWNEPMPATVPFDLESIGWVKACIRIVLGVFIIFSWRGMMKPALFRVLPPLFRMIERIGADLPRRFFLRASEYKKVPRLRRDDNVIPSASEIPQLLGKFRHPRKRAVSVGPQSVADAYETLAYRQKRRRQSVSSTGASPPLVPLSSQPEESTGEYLSTSPIRPRSASSSAEPTGADLLPPQLSSRVHDYEEMMGTGDVPAMPDSPLTSENIPNGGVKPQSDAYSDEEREDQKLFLALERPRVRYDVEVVTKLIVYSGIAWLACEGNPILFEIAGLGCLHAYK